MLKSFWSKTKEKFVCYVDFCVFLLLLQQDKVQSPTLDYYLHEPDLDDSAPLESFHNEIDELQRQQSNIWPVQIRVPLRQKDLYKSTFQRFSETRKSNQFSFDIFRDF